MSAAAKPASAIRVLLAEDQTMLRGALAALLDLEADISVIAQASNGREALKLALQCAPDVIVTDIEMPERTGLDVAADLKLAESKARVIILTTFARPGYLRRALDAGARGYLLKDRPASELRKPSGVSMQASAPLILRSPRKPGAPMKTRSPTASARSCSRRAKAGRPRRSPRISTSPRARFAIIFLKQ